MLFARLIIRWILSKTVRQAVELTHQARKIAQHQKDLIRPQAVEAIEDGIAQVRSAILSGQSGRIREAMNDLEKVANDRLKPYPHASIRENIEVFLVAGAIALGIRTFFLQPMAIPTGSAQPTLYGITEQDLRGQPDDVIPSGIRRFYESWIKGVRYYHKTASESGTLRIIDREPSRVLLFIKKYRFQIGNRVYTQWFPPSELWTRAGLREGQYFEAGQDIYKLRVTAGDHLFVNRFIYNFKRPERGDTIVFLSTGISDRPGFPQIIQNTHYIKRLVALGDETVQIGDDRHLIIDGRRLDASDPGFENVYSFDGPPRDSVFSGHVNGRVASLNGRPGSRLAELFPDENAAFEVRPNHYLCMGDNTMNSNDGRNWGDFAETHVIGRSGFVFWPFTERFGWGQR